MPELKVTVNVDTDDIRDVLTWWDGLPLETLNDRTRRWLTTYNATTGEARERVFDLMPVSLQYCIHEVEQGREDQLRALLSAYSNEGDHRA